MANFFRNRVVKEVGTDAVEMLRLPNNSRATVIGLNIANLTESAVLASVEVEDNLQTVGFYIKEVLVPPNTTLKALNGGEKLILAPDNAIFVRSSLASSIDVILSYVEIV